MEKISLGSRFEIIQKWCKLHNLLFQFTCNGSCVGVVKGGDGVLFTSEHQDIDETIKEIYRACLKCISQGIEPLGLDGLRYSERNQKVG
ncbi:MAG: hypothetical protein D6732_18815 [Methanobacteriota archaeon]|nr:MAG: hypothetical protein D6732_18815 [Euryarchaeota archaeon]